MRREVTALILGLLAGCSEPPRDPTTPPVPEVPDARWFQAQELDFEHVVGVERRLWLPEIMGSGVALFDADQDGDLDLYAVQSGDLTGALSPAPGNTYFENDGRGAFQRKAVGAEDTGYGMGCTVGDYDGDGDPDLYVTNVGPDRLLRNDGASFTDVTEEAGIQVESWTSSATFFDGDGDGDLDLFVAGYVEWSPRGEVPCRSSWGELVYCSPLSLEAPAQDRVFENRGDGTFEDVTTEWGFSGAFGNGLGVVACDFDDNGYTDLYVANDGTANQLWMNSGDGTPRFEDQGLITGSAVNFSGAAEAGMGVAAEDLDGDGDADIFLTHLENETNTFYRNQGGSFVDASARSGLGRASLPWTGFGCVFGDFDQDGFLDLYVVNGRVTAAGGEGPRYAEHDQLFAGRTEGSYELISGRGGCGAETPGIGRGLASGDVDGDGDLDLVTLDNAGRLQVLRNEAATGGWIAALPIEGRSPAVGARVEATIQGVRVVRWYRPGTGYASASAGPVQIGLGETKGEVTLSVRWPDGETETFLRSPGQAHLLERGQGEAAR